MKTQKNILNALLFIIIATFLYTAIAKQAVMYGQVRHLMMKQHLPNWIKTFTAFQLPAIQLIICVMLAIARFRIAGLAAVVLLMVGMSVFIGFVLTEKFGPGLANMNGIFINTEWYKHFQLNVVFIVMAIIAIIICLNLKDDQKTTKMHLN